MNAIPLDRQLNHASRRRLARLPVLAAIGAVCLAAAGVRATSYYVNDGLQVNDIYCSSVGVDANDGLSPATPVASLQTILNRYVLGTDDTVFIDAGTYSSASNVVIQSCHGGSPSGFITLRGAGRLTIFDRQSSATGSRCLENHANYVRFEDLSLTGAEIGLYIDTSTCTYADVTRCTFYGNSFAGCAIEPSGVANYGSFKLANNLVYDNPNGFRLSPNEVMFGDQFTLVNNTVCVSNGTAVFIGGSLYASTLRNNIIVAKGSGACMETVHENGFFYGNYNNLWTPDGGTVCRFQYSGQTHHLATLADWQRFTQVNNGYANDQQSLSRDPRFAAVHAADYHLKSSGGRWMPDGGTNFFWTVDAEHSPCIDAGDMAFHTENLYLEPAPNGGRMNMGAYGGTPQASLSATGRVLIAMAPDVVRELNQEQPVFWNATGEGWTGSETVSLSYSLDGGNGWLAVGHGLSLPVTDGFFGWLRPEETFLSPTGCWIRVVCDSQTNCADAAFLPARTPPNASFYVNDGSTSNDLFCTAPGYDGNTGLSPNSPVASLQTVLSRYTLGPSNTVFVDSGEYLCPSNIVISQENEGAWDKPIRLIGAPGLTVLNRQSAAAGSRCIDLHANYVSIQGFTFTGAEIGLAIDSTDCNYATIARNIFRNNTAAGLSVQPRDSTFYGSFAIFGNLFHDTGDGMRLEPFAQMHGDRFDVYQNTVFVNGGAALIMGGQMSSSNFRNNIVVAAGGGACYESSNDYILFQSDYNDLWTTNGGVIARVTRFGTNTVLATLAAWQRYTQQQFYDARDYHSFSRDPFFADAAKGDFHIRSAGGRWHPGGGWTYDSFTSPCVDTGDPSDDYGLLAFEPSPNGGRLNIGCYGGSPEASKSPTARGLLATAPDLGQELQPICWTPVGQAWGAADRVNLHYSLDNGSTWSVIATNVEALSSPFFWERPVQAYGPNGVRIRVAASNDSSISDQVFLPTVSQGGMGGYTVFYVNDGSLDGDLWCVAPGNVGNDGLTPETPLPSVQAVLSMYQPKAGATIYVDAGTYSLYNPLTLPDTGPGTGPDGSWFTLRGAERKTMFVKPSGSSGPCLLVNQDFTLIEGITFKGGENGIVVVPQTCRNAKIVANTFMENSGYAIVIEPDQQPEGFDTYVISHNIIHDGSGYGLNLQSGSGYHLGSFTVENNTIIAYTGVGIACGGAAGGTVLRNNIVTAKSTGYCLSITQPGVINYSNYNDFYPYNGAKLARAVMAGSSTVQIAGTLADWQNQTGQDGGSISSEPLFVGPSTGDYHLRSAGGSWRNNGTAWIFDTATSPCVDAGDPACDVNFEVAPNGGRINIGAYGGTREASKSAPNRQLILFYPRGGEIWSNSLTITWGASGTGWSSNDTVSLQYSTSGAANSWVTLAGAANLSPSGSFNWNVPNPTVTSASYYLRVLCNQDAAVFAVTPAPGTVIRRTATYYVNDASTTNDLYCTAPGASANSGTSPNAPLNSLQEVFNRYVLKPGDKVYVDVGLYMTDSNILIASNHAGAPDAPIRIIGTRGPSVLFRTAAGTAPRNCLEIHANYIQVEGLACRSGDVGIAVNASSARNVKLLGNLCYANSAWGIEIKPFGSLAGEEFQILENIVYNNGAGIYMQCAQNISDGRGIFVVENNTIYNGGTGVKLLNANPLGKRTNLLKNNIIETTNSQAACILALKGSIHYSDFNNLKARSDGFIGAWQLLPSGQMVFATLSQWRVASGTDQNSRSTDSSFVNPANGNFRLKINSPCIDAGIISYWMFGAADADGKPRIAGKNVDIGAYEIDLRSSVRLFLQGPYISGTANMTAQLVQNGVLPYTSPYADDPRTVTRIPSNVTDWALLQFRLATNGPALISRSVFLRKDGWLVDDAGSSNLSFDLPPGTNGYLVVKHRSHLAAMSALPVAVTNQSLTYDFTQSPEAFFGGTAGCVQVEGPNGPCWALRAGDIDGDGAVLPVDFAICSSLTNTAGYRRSDANLDGMVTPDDSYRVQENLYVSSTVPRPQTVMQPILFITPSRKTLVSGENALLSGPALNSDGTISGGGSVSAASPLLWDFVRHESEAQLYSTGNYEALYTAGPVTGATDIVEAWDTSEGMGRATFNVVGAQTAATAGKAFIIAGRTSAADTLWPTTDYLADNAYSTLRYRGFSKENIHYLSPEPNQDVDGNGLLDDIDGYASWANAQNLFTNAASGADRLFIYLVDHGGNSSGEGYFRLSGTETLTAERLDDWLDNLQDAYNTHVTVLLDFCYAGSFLHSLTYSGTATRIVIAACDTNQPSYFVAGGLVSFSGAFFSGVMLGYDVMDCFNMARNAMSTYQSALLDDDKDGAYTLNDCAQATGSYIGPSYMAGGDAPQIGEVCGNQVLTENATATLWIGSVSSLHPVSRAWCVVVPPGHNPNPDNPITDLPELDLTYDSSNGRYTVTYERFTAAGTYYVSFYVRDEEGNVSAPRSCYVAQIGYDDRVILVAGGDTNSAAWPAIDYLTELAYDTFRLRLFTPDHIRVLSAAPWRDLDGDGSNDIAAVAGVASLNAALNQWARTNSTDRLTLYMIGESVTNLLALNASECLSTNQLAAWLRDYQNTNPIPVTVVLDFSGAGAYLPSLGDPDLAETYPSATRIAIASARIGREALFSNNGVVSFTQYLLSGVISGQTLGDAYDAARRAIRRVSGSVRQSPQIDDNLNGEPNEKDLDGLLADATHIGSAFVTGADAPVIGTVNAPVVLAEPGMPVTLWAGEVAGMYAISNVWCVVTPPDFDAGGDLPAIRLEWDATSQRYQAVSTDFTQPGCYGLTFFAEDAVGELSHPVQSFVILPDAYEPDNADTEAALYDGTFQVHTFLGDGDADWVRFYLVPDFTYDIETYHLTDNLDTVIDLYRQLEDGTLELLDHVDEEGSDAGEYTGLDFPSAGWYWARLSPYSSTTNHVGAFQFIVDIPAADGLNTLIVLGVDDVYANALPSNTTVSVQGQISKPFNGSTTVVYSGLTNGTYLVTVPVPTNFIAREAPNSPYQVQSLTNLTYANPRRVPVSGGWRLAGFEMFSTIAVTSGVVRDAWTHAYLGNAQASFTAGSGSLTGIVVNGGVLLTSYCTNWMSAADGRLPSDIILGSCAWNLAISLAGYETNIQVNAVSNLATGAKTSLGTIFLTPIDANENGLPDVWEALYFGGPADPESDADGDGLKNLAEHRCGTDPTNAASVLRITAAQFGPTNASLTWTVAGGRSYEIITVTSLLDNASATTNGPWEAAYDQTAMQWSATNAPASKARFYRVRLNTP